MRLTVFLLFLFSSSKILCRFDHWVTPEGQVVESSYTCGELAAMFGEFGQIEGELMGFIMRHWKIDSTYNHVYGSANRVLLSPHFLSVSEYLGHVISSFLFLCNFL